MTTQKRQRRRSGQPTPLSELTNTAEHTAPWDWHAPLTAEDRADLAVLEAAAERGYRIAVQCRCCGQWLTNPKSVRGFIGPVCRAKAAAG